MEDSPANQSATSRGPDGTHNIQRRKADVGTQAGPAHVSPPRTPTKRVRFEDQEQPTDNDEPVRKRVAITMLSPSGRTVAHVDVTEYTPRPIDIVTRPWVSEDSIRYLSKFISYRNEKGVWFPIHALPSPPLWAVVDEDARVMHRTHSNRPLLIWVVGTFLEFQLSATRNDRAPRLEVSVDFVRGVDRNHAITLHNQAASSPLTDLPVLTTRSASEDNEGLAAHNEVYDARARFCRRSALSRISPGCIAGGDIVLVECTLVRREHDSGLRTASFVLNALYWLVSQLQPPVVHTFEPPEFPDVFVSQ